MCETERLAIGPPWSRDPPLWMFTGLNVLHEIFKPKQQLILLRVTHMWLSVICERLS
jgi:hypothetical protein